MMGSKGVRNRDAAKRLALKDRATDRDSSGGGGEAVERARIASGSDGSSTSAYYTGSQFAGVLTYDGSGTSWTAVVGAETDSNQILPAATANYSVDITWIVTGATPDSNIKVSAGGPPYVTNQHGGGRSNVPTDGSGNGRTSGHYQGQLGPDAGLAVGGDAYFTAWVYGTQQNR